TELYEQSFLEVDYLFCLLSANQSTFHYLWADGPYLQSHHQPVNQNVESEKTKHIHRPYWRLSQTGEGIHIHQTSSPVFHGLQLHPVDSVLFLESIYYCCQ